MPSYISIKQNKFAIQLAQKTKANSPRIFNKIPPYSRFEIISSEGKHDINNNQDTKKSDDKFGAERDQIMNMLIATHKATDALTYRIIEPFC